MKEKGSHRFLADKPTLEGSLEEARLALGGCKASGSIWMLLILAELPNLICVRVHAQAQAMAGRCTMPPLSPLHNISDRGKSLDLCTHTQ